ncbi:MAG: hypothetical protein KBA14_04430 [Saprospiraceae bacterium]|nr:hypothetical protein [Saprospiraceae bacterium]
MNRLKSIALLLFLGYGTFAFGQEEDLLSLLPEEETVNFVTSSFKANRVVNLHSLENTAGGELDIKISHRFGFISGGLYELFGLDQASIRIGGDYGITDQLMVGLGRSSYEKTYDGFIKYKFLRQSTGAKKMPLTMAALSTMAIKTLKPSDPTRENYFSSNLYYTFQLIMGRKFSESFSLQLSPTLVHRNLVATTEEENDVFAIGVAGRIKLSKRTSLNAEYIYVLPGQLAEQYRNSLSIGFDIETGGHVFQLHFTNSTSMIEKGFVAETVGNWADGDIHFGFNISRTFSVN